MTGSGTPMPTYRYYLRYIGNVRGVNNKFTYEKRVVFTCGPCGVPLNLQHFTVCRAVPATAVFQPFREQGREGRAGGFGGRAGITVLHHQCKDYSEKGSLHCKKRLTIFPSPARMSLTKLSLDRNNLIIPVQGEFG
jgi:hypothetical protein